MQLMHMSIIVIISGAREFKWILSCWNVSCKGEIERRSLDSMLCNINGLKRSHVELQALVVF